MRNEIQMEIRVDTKKLNDAADNLGFSSYEISRRSNVPPPTVQAILNGRNRPTAHNLKAICDVLDLDISGVFIQKEAAA